MKRILFVAGILIKTMAIPVRADLILMDGPLRLEAKREVRADLNAIGEKQVAYSLLLGADKQKIWEIEDTKEPFEKFFPQPPLALFDALLNDDGSLWILLSKGKELQMRMIVPNGDSYEEILSVTVADGQGDVWRVTNASLERIDGEFLVSANGVGGVGVLQWRVLNRDGSWVTERIPETPSLREKEQVLFQRASESLEGLKEFLDSGYDIDARNAGVDNMTILMRAAANGDVELIDEILKRDASVGLRDDRGRSALSWAVKGGKHDAVKKLLDNGAKISEGDALLHRTVAYTSDPALLALLIKEGASLEERVDHLTPLMIAARDGKADMLRELIRLGAKVDVSDEKCETALDLARERPRNSEVIQMLKPKPE